MTGSGWEGAAGVRVLLALRFRARLRLIRGSLRQPRRILLAIFLLVFVSFIVFVQDSEGGSVLLREGSTSLVFPIFVSFFVISASLGAVANGVLAFSKAEIQFLFPAPVGTRTLLFANIVLGMLKSVSAAVVCGVFLCPSNVSILRAYGGFLLLFTALVMLALKIDLMHIALPRSERRRRCLLLSMLVAVLSAVLVVATWLFDGDLGPASFRHLAWLGLPLKQVLMGTDPMRVIWSAAGMLGVSILLAMRVLSHRGNVRDAAGQTSERVQKTLERMQSGAFMLDKPRERTRGLILPMLPSLGGAGVHAWRQLAVLLRQRRSYFLLIFMCGFAGTATLIGVREHGLEMAALVMVAMISIAGPMYIQCDFRCDYDNLTLLRSLPTRPTALAFGQMLASCTVLYVLQLLMGGWALLVTAPERRALWLAAYVALPMLNLIQLSVENGVYLLFPFRLQPAKGPPTIVEFGRMYALMFSKLVILGVVVAVAAVPAIMLWTMLALPAAAVAYALAAACVETLVLIWLVGRIFVRLDPGRDMSE